MAPFEGTIPLSPVPPASSLRFSPIDNAAGFGMALYGAECERLSEEEFTAIREAVLKYDVLVIKGQEKLNPEVQLNLTRRFDPTARIYGHGNAVEAIKKSVLQNVRNTMIGTAVSGQLRRDSHSGYDSEQIMVRFHYYCPLPEILQK